MSRSNKRATEEIFCETHARTRVAVVVRGRDTSLFKYHFSTRTLVQNCYHSQMLLVRAAAAAAAVAAAAAAAGGAYESVSGS